jgi:hypothetical protein
MLLGRISTDAVAKTLGATPLTDLTPTESLEGDINDAVPSTPGWRSAAVASLHA